MKCPMTRNLLGGYVGISKGDLANIAFMAIPDEFLGFMWEDHWQHRPSRSGVVRYTSLVWVSYRGQRGLLAVISGGGPHERHDVLALLVAHLLPSQLVRMQHSKVVAVMPDEARCGAGASLIVFPTLFTSAHWRRLGSGLLV